MVRLLKKDLNILGPHIMPDTLLWSKKFVFAHLKGTINGEGAEIGEEIIYLCESFVPATVKTPKITKTDQ